MVNAVNDINITKNNMGGTPLISVIIPVYNGEKFISETVNNILKSTYRNIEVLLINDGSTDNSAEICRRLVESDERVKYFYKENGGIASARNFGIENAKGDYIAFSDQDDLCKSNIYECLLNDLLSSDSDFVISNYASFTDDINNIKITDYITKNSICEKKEISELQKYNLFHNVLYKPNPELRIPEMVWNCLFSANFIKTNQIKFMRFVNYEDDWLFILQCLQCAERVYLEKDYFYCWRIYPQSTSHMDKYIDDIYHKWRNKIDYLIDYIKKAGFTEQEQKSYLSYISAQAMLRSCLQELKASKGVKGYVKAKKTCKVIVNTEKKHIVNKKVYHEYKNYYGKKAQLYLNLLRYVFCLPIMILERLY